MEDEKVGKMGVRDRMRLYAEECERKKEIENKEKLAVGKMDESMTDVSKFSSPKRANRRYVTDPLTIGKVGSPGLFNFEPEDDPMDVLKEQQRKKAHMNSLRPGMMRGTSFDTDDTDDNDNDDQPARGGRKPNNMRPGMMRGQSFDSDGEREDEAEPSSPTSKPRNNHMRPGMMRGRSFDENHEAQVRESSPPRINTMRPGMRRGTSFDSENDERPQEVKDEDEKVAKTGLAALLAADAKDSKQEQDIVYKKSFSSLRDAYSGSIDKLRPEARPFQVQTKMERRKEAEKVKQYDTLKNAWDNYEETAQDKPDANNLTKEEEAAEEKVKEIENAVAEDWQDYAEEAVKVVQAQENDEDSDSDSEGDDEWDFWILEARRLKEEALRKAADEEMKRKKKAKALKRKEKEARRQEQLKSLEAEDGDIVEMAKRMKEEARKKKEAAAGGAKSKAKEGNDDSNDAKNGSNDSNDATGSKAKNGDKAGKSKSKDRFDSDDDSDDEDAATGSKAKSGDAATGSKAKNGGKAGKSKSKGPVDSDDDSDDSSDDEDAATGSKAKNGDKEGEENKLKKGSKWKVVKEIVMDEPPKKAKEKKGRFDSDSDDSDDDDATGKKAKKSASKKKAEIAEEAPKTPPPPKKKGKAIELVEDKLPSPKTPRNQDGTLWKNPLNRWTNKPKKKIKEVNTQIIFKVPEKTDCWRKTRHNFIMDNAPFNWHKVTGDFEAIVKVKGDFGRMYDKAGIMVREDSENWILTGMEFFNKRVNHSTSVTRDYTDWSLSPLPEGAEKHGIWFCIKRVGMSYETFYSLDGKRWIQTRQGVFSDKAVLKVGLCCACPMGDEWKVTFEGYRLKPI
jgi:regulation of enolase protein 1 (concanavalin A-like superfamily)